MQELANITETREHENNKFEQELNDIQGKQKKTDREIRNIENDFESTKPKIIKRAKGSQTACLFQWRPCVRLIKGWLKRNLNLGCSD